MTSTTSHNGKIRYKKSLTPLDLSALARELKEMLQDMYISKIYQLGEILLLRFHESLKGSHYLIIIPGKSIYITNYTFPKPSSPPPFCTSLRKHVLRKKVVDVVQVNFDKIIKIELSGEYKLIIELVREGNVILLDEQDKIISALRYKKMRDREIAKGVTYTPPPAKGFSPWDLTDEFWVNIQKCPKNIINGLYEKLSLSKETIKEICVRANLDPRCSLSALSVEQLTRLRESLRELLLEVKERPLKPNIVYSVDDDKTPVNVHPIVFKSEKGRVEYFDTFSKALDQYFRPFLEQMLREIFYSRQLEEQRKIEKIIEEQRKAVSIYKERAEKVKEVADILSTRINELQYWLNNFWDKVDRGAVKESLSEFQEVLGKITGINVKLDFDYDTRALQIVLFGEKLTLQYRASAGSFLSLVYSSYKKNKEKALRAEMELAKSKTSKMISASLLEEGAKDLLKEIKSKKWYEKFRWFITSDGFLVIAGKDAAQNEVLVKKYMDDEDIFMHADILGAPVTIIKTNKRSVPVKTLEEAAEFAAAYSRAWKLGLSCIDVFWVKGSQVSKSPPSGEYLKKGSFMIYGKRNYIRKVPLRLAVGLVKVSNNELAVEIAPPGVIQEKTKDYMILVPGTIRKQDIVKNMLKFFKYVVKKYGVKVNIQEEELSQKLPAGGFFILLKNGVFESYTLS